MIKIRDLKENEWVKCDNEEEVRVLWNWFNDHGHVISKDQDSLERMKKYFKDYASDIFCYVDNGGDFGWTYDYSTYNDYINFKDLIISDSESNSSILKVNPKPQPTMPSIRDLKDGQMFIMSDGDAEYLAVKASNIDGEVYVLQFDHFLVLDDVDAYTVVRLKNYEMNEV